MQYITANLDHILSGIKAEEPMGREDIIILNLVYPLGNSEAEIKKRMTMTEIAEVIKIIKSKGYQGVVADFTGDHPTATLAAAYCYAFQQNGFKYWFVNCRFESEDNRIPGVTYEEPEQRRQNASSIDEAVKKVIDLLNKD